MNAIDTNILIYSIDSRDQAKRRLAVELIEGLPEAETVIPWQVACETAAVLQTMTRTGHFKGDYAEAVAALHGCFPIVLPVLPVLERSIRIQLRDQVSTWDAMLIAACAEAGVNRLYTEDMQGKPRIEGVEMVNPFAEHRR